jgi:N4-(beta-N-acetylglucosaminyl)-L-asparaginase
MRQGMAPKDAGMLALKRIAANTVEKRLLNSRGQPNFNVNFYILNTKGEYAGVALYAGHFALCSGEGPQTLDSEPLFPGKPED